MDAGIARNRVSEGNEGTVGNVEKNTVMRTDQVAEERDLVGVYLHEISRTPLLDAAREVELSKAIEAGLYAEHLLDEGEVRRGTSREELERVVFEGERAKDLFIRANLRLVVSIARRYVRSGMPMLDLIQEGNTGLARSRSSTTSAVTSSRRTRRGGSARRSAGRSPSRSAPCDCRCISSRTSTGCATSPASSSASSAPTRSPIRSRRRWV
jgi:hypothetical protein